MRKTGRKEANKNRKNKHSHFMQTALFRLHKITQSLSSSLCNPLVRPNTSRTQRTQYTKYKLVDFLQHGCSTFCIVQAYQCTLSKDLPTTRDSQYISVHTYYTTYAESNYNPKIVALPGCYAAQIGNQLPTGCPETSVSNYQSTLRNIPEERRSRLHREGT